MYVGSWIYCTCPNIVTKLRKQSVNKIVFYIINIYIYNIKWHKKLLSSLLVFLLHLCCQTIWQIYSILVNHPLTVFRHIDLYKITWGPLKIKWFTCVQPFTFEMAWELWENFHISYCCMKFWLQFWCHFNFVTQNTSIIQHYKQLLIKLNTGP